MILGSRHLALFVSLLTALALVVPLSGCGGEKEKRIVVGGKNFTEQYILAELATILLEKNGYTVVPKTGVGSVIARQSLENGQIDLYYEYTGTAYTVFYKKKDREIMSDPEKCYDWVKAADESAGLIWLDPIKFNNTYTLMMRKEQAESLKISSVSDMARFIKKNPGRLTVAVNSEFWERPDGFKRLMEVYDFSLKDESVRKMETGLTYFALKNGEIDIAMGFSTDGRIAAFGFVSLVDDKNFFPVYNPAPVVRKPLLDRHPEIQKILLPIAKNLTTKEMRELNAAVDIEHKRVHDAALSWLKEEGIVTP